MTRQDVDVSKQVQTCQNKCRRVKTSADVSKQVKTCHNKCIYVCMHVFLFVCMFVCAFGFGISIFCHFFYRSGYSHMPTPGFEPRQW